MDRNTRLAMVLSLGVVSVWLMYESGRQPPPVDPTLDPGVIAEQAGGSDATRQYDPDQRRDADSGPFAGRDDEAAGRRPFERPRHEVPEDRARVDIAPWQGTINGSLYVAKLTNRGGALSGWELTEFQTLEDSDEQRNVELITIGAVDGVAPRTPLRGLGFGDLGDALYEVESESENRVVFRLERGDIQIRKTYEFDLETYGFELTIDIDNRSNRVFESDLILQWPAGKAEGNDYTEQSLVVLHKDAEEDVERELLEGVGGSGFFGGLFGGGSEDVIWREIRWAGADMKYFAALLLPEEIQGTRAEFAPLVSGESAFTRLALKQLEIGPGQTATRRVSAFLGPKDPAILEGLGGELTRSIDLGYSWLEPLTLFFQWLLITVYSWVPNYGLAIVLITILVRVCSLPIMNRQMRSMERMRALQPRLKEIQEEHKDDKQKQSEATMALYKETGVNPLAGCLPMILQMPVFIGLFYALQSSFALRQAPFFGWMTDLSSPEALFVFPIIDLPFRLLPVIMGASMILQQKLTPTTVDPSQQMMMMVMMPVMMTVLFYQFPSGLVLYWMISNFLAIGHQLLVGRRMRAPAT